MSGAAKKPIPPAWSVIPGGPILTWSLGVEKRYGGMFKLRFYRIVSDAKAKNGKRRIPAVSRLSYILFYSYPYLSPTVARFGEQSRDVCAEGPDLWRRTPACAGAAARGKYSHACLSRLSVFPVLRQLHYSSLLNCHAFVCLCVQDRSLAWPPELEALVMESAMKHADAASGRIRWGPVMEDLQASKLPHSAQLNKSGH